MGFSKSMVCFIGYMASASSSRSIMATSGKSQFSRMSLQRCSLKAYIDFDLIFGGKMAQGYLQASKRH